LELEEAANAAQAQADHEAETLAALENAARDSPFPLSKDQWTAQFTRDFVLHSTTLWRELPRGLVVIVSQQLSYSVHSESSIHPMLKLSLIRMLLH
jgi:hypothetical protein